MLTVLAIITARGGSKGIPKKNLHPLAGKPLIHFTIAAAKKARSISSLVISTDDAEIAAVADQLGVEVPFLRPAQLAADSTPTIPVLNHVIQNLESLGRSYDAILTLQPTSPLRLPSDIDGAVELLERTGADSVISFVPCGEKHPARMKFISDAGQVVDPPFAEQFEGQPRQSLQPIYLRDGSIYLTRRSVLVEQHSLRGRDCRAWIIPPERACNIDTPFDIFLAEQLLHWNPELRDLL